MLSHVFVKSRNSLCHSINFKKLFGLGRTISHPTCNSVTEDYGIETYIAKAYELLDIETTICACLLHIMSWENNSR